MRVPQCGHIHSLNPMGDLKMGRADIGVSQLGQCMGSGLAVKRAQRTPKSHAAKPTITNAEMM
jgi:hypothetical protein